MTREKIFDELLGFITPAAFAEYLLGNLTGADLLEQSRDRLTKLCSFMSNPRSDKCEEDAHQDNKQGVDNENRPSSAPHPFLQLRNHGIDQVGEKDGE